MGIERRKIKRVLLDSTASIVDAGNSYIGTIKNISEDGIEYLLTSLPNVSSEFIPGKAISLILNDLSGKKHKLTCEVKWYLRGKGSDSSVTLGMKVSNPPSKYKELIESLTAGK